MPMKWHPILEIVAGILILVRPTLAAYIAGIYLIIIGVMGLTGGKF